MMLKVFFCCAAITATIAPGNGVGAREFQDSALSEYVRFEYAGPVPITNFTLVFDHSEAVWQERRPVGAVLALVADFFTERTDLPRAAHPPRIEFASSARIAALRYGDVSLEPELLLFARPNVLDMFYDPGTKTIYLSEFWTGGSPAELSVLVHGMVNHAQSEAGLAYPCPQRREQVAFAAQDAWLRMFGQDVKTALGLDEVAFLFSTECIP